MCTSVFGLYTVALACLPMFIQPEGQKSVFSESLREAGGGEGKYYCFQKVWEKKRQKKADQKQLVCVCCISEGFITVWSKFCCSFVIQVLTLLHAKIWVFNFVHFASDLGSSTPQTQASFDFLFLFFLLTIWKRQSMLLLLLFEVSSKYHVFSGDRSKKVYKQTFPFVL